MPPPTTSMRFGIWRNSKRAGGIDDARVVRHERQFHRLRSGGNDRVGELHDGLAGTIRMHGLDMVRIEEAARGRDDGNLARLGHVGQPASELADDVVLERPERVEIDLRRAVGDAVGGHGLDFVHDGGGVQQRLGRDAADIEADAAKHLPALDQDGIEAEIRCSERRRIAARTGPENDDIACDITAARVRRGGRRRRSRRCR